MKKSRQTMNLPVPEPAALIVHKYRLNLKKHIKSKT
jgi:hypothetical protein